MTLYIEFSDSSSSHLCDKRHFLDKSQPGGYSKGLRMHPLHTLWAHTARTWLTSRTREQKRSSGGGELHLASHSWESLFCVHPPKLTRTSLEGKLKNIGAFVPSTATLLKHCSVSMPAKTIALRENAAEGLGQACPLGVSAHVAPD